MKKKGIDMFKHKKASAAVASALLAAAALVPSTAFAGGGGSAFVGPDELPYNLSTEVHGSSYTASVGDSLSYDITMQSVNPNFGTNNTVPGRKDNTRMFVDVYWSDQKPDYGNWSEQNPVEDAHHKRVAHRIYDMGPLVEPAVQKIMNEHYYSGEDSSFYQKYYTPEEFRWICRPNVTFTAFGPNGMPTKNGVKPILKAKKPGYYTAVVTQDLPSNWKDKSSMVVEEQFDWGNPNGHTSYNSWDATIEVK